MLENHVFMTFDPPAEQWGTRKLWEFWQESGFPPVLLGVTMSDFYPMLGVNFVFCF